MRLWTMPKIVEMWNFGYYLALKGSTPEAVHIKVRTRKQILVPLQRAIFHRCGLTSPKSSKFGIFDINLPTKGEYLERFLQSSVRLLTPNFMNLERLGQRSIR